MIVDSHLETTQSPYEYIKALAKIRPVETALEMRDIVSYPDHPNPRNDGYRPIRSRGNDRTSP